MDAVRSRQQVWPGRRKVVAIGAVLGAVLVLVAVARVQLGPAPEPAAGIVVDTRPPLVQGPAQAADDALVDGAAMLAAGDHAGAAELFADALSRDAGNAHAQVGLALAQWEVSPQQAVRRIRDATTIAPDDPWLWLNLGLAQTVGLGPGRGEGAFEQARLLAGAAADHAAYRTADDLRYPDLAPGYPPLVLAPGEVAGSPQRRGLRSLAAAIEADDRPRAARIAGRLDTQGQDLETVVASVMGRYAKERHTVAVGELARLRAEHPGSSLVAFHHALLLLWQGDRSGAVAGLDAAAADGGPRAEVARRLLVATAGAPSAAAG